jgi:predicted DNA-binding transcriptional regulator YafY
MENELLLLLSTDNCGLITFMRAERLLSIMLLLQSQKQMSASKLAQRLAVSERTIQRDMESLSMAGIPLISERGRTGGWSLLEGYRNNLTGLKDAEIQALILSPARVLQDLGLEDAAEAATLKLLASLPAFRRHEAEMIRQCIYVDAAPWQSSEEDLGRMPLIQEAIWQSRRALIHYHKAENVLAERLIEPLGLVAKGCVWYCVARVEQDYRTYRISRIASVELGESFTRPLDFDLAAYWKESSREFAAKLPRYPAILRVHHEAMLFLHSWRWARIEAVEEEGDWRIVHVNFEEIEEASAVVLSCAGQATVIEPTELAKRVDEKIAALVSSKI